MELTLQILFALPTKALLFQNSCLIKLIQTLKELDNLSGSSRFRFYNNLKNCQANYKFKEYSEVIKPYQIQI